jgi:hypothetical protein
MIAIEITGGAHCTGVGCEHDPHAVAVPMPIDPPRHRISAAARHVAVQPSRRPTPRTRSTATP